MLDNEIQDEPRHGTVETIPNKDRTLPESHLKDRA